MQLEIKSYGECLWYHTTFPLDISMKKCGDTKITIYFDIFTVKKFCFFMNIQIHFKENVISCSDRIFLLLYILCTYVRLVECNKIDMALFTLYRLILKDWKSFTYNVENYTHIFQQCDVIFCQFEHENCQRMI